MHELSLCYAIVGVVKPHAAGRRVDVVRLQVGALRQVVPDSLSFCWTLVCEAEEELAGAELVLELIPAEVSCRACGRRSVIASRFSVACPECASPDVEVMRGKEFLVTSVDVSDIPSKGVHHG